MIRANVLTLFPATNKDQPRQKIVIFSSRLPKSGRYDHQKGPKSLCQETRRRLHMKIDNPNLNPTGLPPGASTAGAAGTRGVAPAAPGAASRTEAASSSRNDAVQLSSLSQRLAELQPGSPEREAKLDRLAADFQNGSLGIDAAAISRNIVDEALSETQATPPQNNPEENE
jgi:flagellar biosynthesis anti-sigma factor FlgM